MHPEKGFTLKESNYRDFMACIRQVAEALNWELFCEKRPNVDEELVCEFYANLTSSELIELPVRRIKGIITDWDLYRVVGDSVLWQQVEESEDPEEE
ncbi:hypothetical protein J1N35_007807 [Gossypium stocksii]|uniref:Uncharacterized protein n=1 Tax=Gossypium stocksii TaxID=47602 RepID=A0A9D3W6R0_9ROSI|nr:hypothetical protein J1N35_007807 [Gossypium stocksii]